MRLPFFSQLNFYQHLVNKTKCWLNDVWIISHKNLIWLQKRIISKWRIMKWHSTRLKKAEPSCVLIIEILSAVSQQLLLTKLVWNIWLIKCWNSLKKYWISQMFDVTCTICIVTYQNIPVMLRIVSSKNIKFWCEFKILLQNKMNRNYPFV